MGRLPCILISTSQQRERRDLASKLTRSIASVWSFLAAITTTFCIHTLHKAQKAILYSELDSRTRALQSSHNSSCGYFGRLKALPHTWSLHAFPVLVPEWQSRATWRDGLEPTTHSLLLLFVSATCCSSVNAGVFTILLQTMAVMAHLSTLAKRQAYLVPRECYAVASEVSLLPAKAILMWNRPGCSIVAGSWPDHRVVCRKRQLLSCIFVVRIMYFKVFDSSSYQHRLAP